MRGLWIDVFLLSHFGLFCRGLTHSIMFLEAYSHLSAAFLLILSKYVYYSVPGTLMSACEQTVVVEKALSQRSY